MNIYTVHSWADSFYMSISAETDLAVGSAPGCTTVLTLMQMTTTFYLANANWPLCKGLLNNLDDPLWFFVLTWAVL